MRYLIICFLFCLFCHNQTFGQVKTDTIEINKKKHSYYFEKDGKVLTLRKMYVMMRSDPESKRLIKKAKLDCYAGFPLTCIGGGMIGFEIGKLATGNKLSPFILGAGVAVTIFSIHLSKTADRLELKAAKHYNEALAKTTSKVKKPEYYLSFLGNRIGMTMWF